MREEVVVRMPTYPAPIPPDPARPDVQPRASALGNIMRQCPGCKLWHEIPTGGQLERVTCSCGWLVWHRKPLNFTTPRTPVVLTRIWCDYGHQTSHSWCSSCRGLS